MIRRMSNYFSTVPSAFIDGFVYCILAVVPPTIAWLMSDQTAKYVSPFWIWLVVGVLTIFNALILAIKMFRSTAFADHKNEKKASGDTTHITKP